MTTSEFERSRQHGGNRFECRYEVPPVCSARWTQEDWDNRCRNPKHVHDPLCAVPGCGFYRNDESDYCPKHF